MGIDVNCQLGVRRFLNFSWKVPNSNHLGSLQKGELVPPNKNEIFQSSRGANFIYCYLDVRFYYLLPLMPVIPRVLQMFFDLTSSSFHLFLK